VPNRVEGLAIGSGQVEGIAKKYQDKEVLAIKCMPGRDQGTPEVSMAKNVVVLLIFIVKCMASSKHLNQHLGERLCAGIESLIKKLFL
jgi:hypothetical protein